VSNAQHHHEFLRQQRDAITADLERFTTIESGSREKHGVDAAGRAASSAFEALGFTVERIEETECGDHVIARRAGAGQGKLLALIHLDTLWPGGTLEENPFRVEDGLAFGPGIRDMKGGWVVLLSALRALQHAGWDGLREIAVFMTGDEQLGSPRGRQWIEKEADDSDWVVVMEPARGYGGVVTSRGIVGAVYFDIHGVAAPANARPAGSSAILEAAMKIPELEALSQVERGMMVSVGLIRGGTARQTVPAHVWMSIDLRAERPEDADDLLGDMRRIAAHAHVAGTRTVMSGGVTRPAFRPSEGTNRLLALAQRHGSAVGLDVEATFTRGGSDGSFTAALGVPTLDGLGAASRDDTDLQEHVIIDSIPQRGALLAALIEDLPALLDTE
jgi:glutamate carboxypeptidase